jgi:hypothetical protein
MRGVCSIYGIIWVLFLNHFGISIREAKYDPRFRSSPLSSHRIPVDRAHSAANNWHPDQSMGLHRLTLQDIEGVMEFEKIPIINTPYHPFFMEFHMTRYFGECFKYFDHNSFNTISPWLRNFQIIVGFCSIDWKTSLMSYLPDSCAFKFDDQDPKQIEFYAHYNITFLPGVIRRIHIHSDRRHHKYFVDKIIPYLEKRAMLTGERYTIHSGGGDASQMLDIAQTILNNKIIKHWIIEQNILDEIIHHPKVIQLPVGICGRENSGQLGTELRQIIKEITTTTTDSENNNHNNSTISSIDSSHRLLLQAIDQSKSQPFHTRLNRILFCFSDSYPKRKLILDYLHANPQLSKYCDICSSNYSQLSSHYHHLLREKSNQKSPDPGYALTHIELWELYSKYKFVFSPWGNGPDCGRNWEILLLGAIPVIQYFSGAIGYLKANLNVILLHHEMELNEQNITNWIVNYQESTPIERLSRDYWNDYLFHYHKTGKM